MARFIGSPPRHGNARELNASCLLIIFVVPICFGDVSESLLLDEPAKDCEGSILDFL